eukprot:CAMPEP_0119274798 /NCGR_PEP_ID=MMETSP1329-20130426/12707_1 /TAXON_ID=114041 /ORGANISM="Genus nov. species nov., Strain RCC1024" /LENGTH=45 /DNA_ID= /DNA_START= /DNA_END= /DNA_ORIENTATION=
MDAQQYSAALQQASAAAAAALNPGAAPQQFAYPFAPPPLAPAAFV